MTSKAQKMQDFQFEEGQDFIQKMDYSGRNLILRPRIFVSEFFGPVTKKNWQKFLLIKFFFEIFKTWKNIKLFYIGGLLLRKTDNSSSKSDEVGNFH